MSFFFFFFSSRRRHTRYWRDWSSDVCSSDLLELGALVLQEQALVALLERLVAALEGLVVRVVHPGRHHRAHLLGELGHPRRSEERRVGKECRSRWSPYH